MQPYLAICHAEGWHVVWFCNWLNADVCDFIHSVTKRTDKKDTATRQCWSTQWQLLSTLGFTFFVSYLIFVVPVLLARIVWFYSCYIISKRLNLLYIWKYANLFGIFIANKYFRNIRRQILGIDCFSFGAYFEVMKQSKYWSGCGGACARSGTGSYGW